MTIDYETYADISAALGSAFGDELYHQFNRTATALSGIQARPATNKVPAWDVEFTAGTAGASYAEGSDIVDAEYTVDKPVPAVLTWGRYRKPFALTETEIKTALASRGSPAALTDIFEDRLFTTTANLANAINADLFVGDGLDGSSNETIVGFYGGALAASGSYAGIDRGTYTEHAATVLANGGTPRSLTLDLLNQAEEQIFRKCGRTPDWIMTSTGVRRKYASLFENVQRFVNDGRGSMQYNMGATELFFQGNPVRRDKDASTGKLIMGVEEFMDIQFLPPLGMDRDTAMNRMRMLQGTNGRPADRVTATAIPLQVSPLAKTGNNVKFNLSVELQLRIRRCNAFCVIEDISET